MTPESPAADVGGFLQISVIWPSKWPSTQKKAPTEDGALHRTSKGGVIAESAELVRGGTNIFLH
jgi:hypothetical protein